MRRRLQIDGTGGRPARFAGFFDCCAQIVRREGVGALYRGLGATIVKGVPNTGIQFGVYELLKDMFGLQPRTA